MAVRLPAPVRRRRIVSLTPLVDVVFILLVFFMLASTFDRQATVGLVVGAPGTRVPPTGAVLVVVVRADGAVEVDGVVLAPTMLARRLAGAPTPAVVLRPQPRARLEVVVPVLDALGAAGVRAVTVDGASP
ncbi:MAG: biopolymer transporter ExbD [Chromatiales bacterium]|nr:biopolymer transporter ExbD [Chromatiales bacterium]